jgi:hypothetical protein
MPDPALTQLAESRRIAAEMHVELVKAAGASDRAVMADTDDSSVSFARDAERATRAVQSGMGELGPRLQSLGYHDEAHLLDEFATRFAEYQKVDHDVLSLAVENTNLKAQRLSFGPVEQAADAFRDAVVTIVKGAPAKDRCRLDEPAARAVLAVREIQVLQAPHIAEADDAAMKHLETEMAAREATARDALKTLEGSVPPKARPEVAAASMLLDKFDALSAQLVALSRQNTNVRSLQLALRQKPSLTAACDVRLTALEDALSKKGFSGTR